MPTLTEFQPLRIYYWLHRWYACIHCVLKFACAIKHACGLKYACVDCVLKYTIHYVLKSACIFTGGIRVFVYYGCRCRVVLNPLLRDPGGSINLSPGPQYTIRNDPLKLKVDAKHRLLMLNTSNVDEYFQNTSADLRHVSSQAPLGPWTTDLKS